LLFFCNTYDYIKSKRGGRGGDPEGSRRGGGLAWGKRGGDERARRSRAVGDGRNTIPAIDEDEKVEPEQSKASYREEDPTPAAKGLTGVEEDGVRRCFGNRVWERKP
ncbi:unnamed protein product, partial [Brassica rapa subsp. narinosa]